MVQGRYAQGPTRGDLRVGTYAFGGATPGDQRVLAALGAGQRPAASEVINSVLFYWYYVLTTYIVHNYSNAFKKEEECNSIPLKNLVYFCELQPGNIHILLS